MKVSLHATGECQWSATDVWVRRQANARNAARHVYRWRVDYPTGNEAMLVFRVEIPVSELRPLPEPTDKKKVWWVSGTPAGYTLRFLFYITRPHRTDPARLTSDQMRHLFSLQLRRTRWLVAFVEVISLSAADLAAARTAVLELSKAAGIEPGPDHRFSLFMQPPPEGGAHGLLELCATEA